MPKKLYYDDPLAAAYMAREFGVELDGSEFSHNGTKEELHYALDDLFYCCGYFPKDGKKNRLYTHPDSLHIFEPQVYDLVEVHGCFIAMVWKVVDKYFLWNETSLNNPPEEPEHYEKMESSAISQVDRIIQRNGKPFFWPKEESNAT